MALTATQRQDAITRWRQYLKQLSEILAEGRRLKYEYDATGLSSSVADGDFQGENADITALAFTTAVASVDAIQTFVDSNNHDTNIETIKS